MKLTMSYLQFYPMQELALIGLMLNSSRNYSSLLRENAENDNIAAIHPEVSEEQQASVAEAAFVYEDFLSELDQLAAQMTVVALHSLGEKTLRKILASRDIKAGNKFSDIKNSFSQKEIDLNSIAEYSAFTEVRYASNSIKHSGVVSKCLARHPDAIYPDPKLGDPIYIQSVTLKQYFLRSELFLRNICRLA